MTDWKSCLVEVTGASIADLITHINSTSIKLKRIRYIDDLRISVCISSADYQKMKTIVEKRGGAVKLISKKGAYYAASHFLTRPILLVGIIIWTALIFCLPTRVIFVYVDGNHDVTTETIIDAATACGIHIGASRRYVRSEAVKNTLLSKIEGLQWVGVNTRGCVAIISVKERSIPSEESKKHKVNSIIASQDGVVSSITAVKGYQLCKIGQAVRKGQVLVSAFTDCGRTVKAENAAAEVYALTNRNLSAVMLAAGTERQSLKGTKVRYSIQLGKNIIKLYKDSRISDASCVKMYTERSLVLPGGFVLPIKLVKESLDMYYCEEKILALDKHSNISQLAEEYLINNMVSGRILSTAVTGETVEDIYHFRGTYTCEEMIAQVRAETVGEYDG